MADEAQTIRNINWRDVFPFTNLFKAFRVAVHPSKLVLALTALLLIYFGGLVLDQLWPNRHLVHNTAANVGFYHPDRSSARDADNPRGIFRSFFFHQVNQLNAVVGGVLSPNPARVVAGVAGFVVAGPAWLLREHPVYFTLFAIWFLLIWSIFGGAISRIAAVHVARDEKISVRQAIRFSVNKLLSFAFAPLIPVIILLVIGAVVAFGGLLLYIPYVGPIALGLVFILALVAGLVMTLVLLGLLGGFNLMYPTIAVEGSDSFDAISRSFSYVFARPWRMLFYTLVAVAYGALTYTFVKFFIWLLLSLTHYFVGWWLTGQPQMYWDGTGPERASIWPAPNPNGDLPYTVDHDHLKWSESVAAGFISFWVYLVIGLLGAYAISFYFSANTIIYFLMRREVDATELEDVYVEETEDEFADTPTATGGTLPGDPAAAAAVPATPAATTRASNAADSSSPSWSSSASGGVGDSGGGASANAGTGNAGAIDSAGATNTPPGTASTGDAAPEHRHHPRLPTPAPATPATSAPGGGVTGTAGSADPGSTGDAQPYTAPQTDAPPDQPSGGPSTT
jgi:hypothetical protein